MKNIILREKMAESIADFALPRYDEIDNVDVGCVDNLAQVFH